MLPRTLLPVLSLMLGIFLLISCRYDKLNDEQRMALAVEICQGYLVLDSHIDWPESILMEHRNIAEENAAGNFDLVRSEKGGLNAVLSSLYIDPDFNVAEGRGMFDSLYQIVASYNATYPDRFAPAVTPEDIYSNFHNDLLSIPVILENGSIIGNEIEYISHLKDLGIVYITLNHSRSNQISDSNMDSHRPWNGLSPFGERVVDEMNRQGILIDISHSTDSTVAQVLRRSKAPIVASHSSCRYFTPGFERNLPDQLIRDIAEKDGVVMVAFGSMFLDSVCSRNIVNLINYFDSTGLELYSEEGMRYLQEYVQQHQVLAESHQVADHIDHIVRIAGINHVGLGSDFDGVGPSLPVGLQDVSTYPVIVAELLKRGYTKREIKKILGENFLRIWSRALEVSDSSS